MMKKFLGIIILGLLLGNKVYADNTTTFKCDFEKDNYEYIINLYTKNINQLQILNMGSKKIYHSDPFKKAADITVITEDTSYKFKGFNNHSSDVEYYFFFTDKKKSLYAYLVLNKDEETKPNSFNITSFDSGVDMITKGTCKAFY